MPPAPIGRMPALSCEVLPVAEWYAAMLDAITEASEVFLAIVKTTDSAIIEKIVNTHASGCSRGLSIQPMYEE